MGYSCWSVALVVPVTILYAEITVNMPTAIVERNLIEHVSAMAIDLHQSGDR
jgi:hypothetical protein